jgi:hypothetical protein
MAYVRFALLTVDEELFCSLSFSAFTAHDRIYNRGTICVGAKNNSLSCELSNFTSGNKDKKSFTSISVTVEPFFERTKKENFKVLR